MHMSIFSLNSGYVRFPNDLEKVMLTSHVDDLGNIDASVNFKDGELLNPAAGNLFAPEMK